MKKILLFFAMLSVTTIAMSQIKVATSGNVGVGTNDPSKGKLVIAYNGSEFVFHPCDKQDGKSYFGSYNPKDPWINFYHPKTHYNKVRFKQSVLSSDSTVKTAIAPLRNATIILKQIKSYSYYFKSDSIFIKSDSIDERKRDYGVLAQEVQKVMPDLVDTCNGEMFVNYNAFIAILIKGFNEQQTLIEQQQTTIEQQQSEIGTLQYDIKKLQKITTIQEEELRYIWELLSSMQVILIKCCDEGRGLQAPLPLKDPEDPFQSPQNLQSPSFNQERAILCQNTPNPFSSNTEIVCHLPETTQQAAIYIYNLQGTELKAYPLTQAGLNTITVYGSELPAGMYLYTLVADNDIIDTKRMILTK